VGTFGERDRQPQGSVKLYRRVDVPSGAQGVVRVGLGYRSVENP
jgi:hypothetical protein